MPTFDTPEPITVTLALGVGTVEVTASDRVDTVVEVEPSDPSSPSDVTTAQQTRVEYANGVLQLKAPKGWKRHTFRGASESIVVRIGLPTGSLLRGEAAVADLRSTGTLGGCRYKTAAGDIALQHVAGGAELTTTTGAVTVEWIGGSGVIKNSNGDTWIGETVGDLEVRAANGRIQVDRAGAAVTAKTANGDIRLDDVGRSAVVAETACGTVEVGVRDGVAAWLDLHTGFGRVRNLLDPGEGPEPSEDTVEVRARSSFGDITIRRTGTSGRGQDVA